jgi:hypothetical protein
MYKIITVTLFMLVCLLACTRRAEINMLPMYGGVEKDQDYLNADKRFIETVEKNMTRDSASKYFAMKGWEFLGANRVDLAIKRFNQAWLLDTNNYQAYWGFAAYYRTIGKPENEVNQYFKMAYSKHKKDCALNYQTLTSYLFMQNKGLHFNKDEIIPILRVTKEMECSGGFENFQNAVCAFGFGGEFDVFCE